jgi:hypothetical protein
MFHPDDTYCSNPTRTAWYKAQKEDICCYKNMLSKSISGMSISKDVLHCQNVLCNDPSHTDEIDIIYNNLVDAMVNASKKCIPVNSNSKRQSRGIPGWKEHVAPHRETALFWRDIWKDCGAPKQGIVAEIMRNTRAKYHRAVKDAKRARTCIVNHKLAGSLMNKKTADFWKQIKANKSSVKFIPSVIDGVSSEQGISELFADKFRELYNCVNYNAKDMCELDNQVKTNISNNHTENVYCNISVDEVSSAISSLKPRKRDGCCNIFTDNYIHSSCNMLPLLASLLSCMMKHGYCPHDMLRGTIVPIPKTKGTTSSDKYRGIALSTILVKIMEKIIVIKVKDFMSTSNLQYGFKRNSSTTSCTFIVQEVISYFNDHDSSVICTLLDASKAFDRVNFCILFQKILNRGMPSVIIRMLMYMYKNQSLCVQWNSYMSNHFSVTNGVKQGGIISPSLFCIYVDDLLRSLHDSGVGCKLGPHYYGSMGYDT